MTHTNTMGEFDRIKTYFAPLTVGDMCPHAPAPIATGVEIDSVGLQDDCATIKPPAGCELVVNMDTLVAGTHFVGTESPQSLAQKILAVNISDMVGKGAYAVAYTLSLTLPKHIDTQWVAGFANGLQSAQSDMGVVLMGGDSTLGNTLTITATLFGVVPVGGMKRRCDAVVGDDVWIVGGTVGDGYLGLQVALGKLDLPPHQIPPVLCQYESPNVHASLNTVVADYANGAMDISDGVVADAQHMATASAVGIELWADTMPLSQIATDWIGQGGSLETLLTGGDDYVVLMTANKNHRTAITQALDTLNIVGNPVGTITNGNGVTVYEKAGGSIVNIKQGGYTHY